MLCLRGMKWLLPVALTISLAGCGGSKHKLVNANTCSATWQALIGPKPWDSTSSLVYNDGTLYYGSYARDAIIAQPVDGSPSRVFAAVPTLELWLEGDHLPWCPRKHRRRSGRLAIVEVERLAEPRAADDLARRPFLARQAPHASRPIVHQALVKAPRL